MSRRRGKATRDYTTKYFRSATDGEGAWVTQGHCFTEAGARRSTVVRLIDEQYAMARVYNRRTEVLLWTYRRTANGDIKKSWGRHEEEVKGNVIQLKRRLK